MVYKKKITKIKLNFQKPSKMKLSTSTGITNHKSNLPQSVVNAEKLPCVHVSLTRLMPTKMPHIAKEQYFNLVKSSGLLNVIPAGKTSWDALSPEATPERESGKTNSNPDMLSSITRIQLQSSPVDLNADYADLSNEPWSDSPKPSPSPKSSTNDENIESDGLFNSKPFNKSWPFEHEEDADLLCTSPCDKEVEAIMAHHDCKVHKDVPDIPVHRPNKNLLGIVIPLQPVDRDLAKLDNYRDDSPVFERNGICPIPAIKSSTETTRGAVENMESKRKKGRPKKRDLTNFVDLNCSNDGDRSSFPIVSRDQPSRQENTEKREGKCEEGPCRDVTKLVAKRRFGKKRTKIGRRRKRRRLDRVGAPALSNPRGFNCSNDHAKSTLLRESSEQRETKNKDETSQSEVRVSPVVLETNICNISQESPKVSIDVTEQNITLNAEDCLDPQTEGQGSATSHQQTPVLIEVESSSSVCSDLYSTCEMTFERIPVEGDDQVREITATPQKISKWLSAVEIDTSPLIKSLELDKKQNGVKRPPEATVFLQDQEENCQVRETTASPQRISKWLGAVKIEASPLIKSLELDKKQNGVKSPPKATVFLQDQEENCQVRETTASPQRISKWLGAVKIEASPLIKSLVLDKKQNSTKSPSKATVFCQEDKHQRLMSSRQEVLPDKELSVNGNVSKCKLRKRKLFEEGTPDPKWCLKPLEIRLSACDPVDAGKYVLKSPETLLAKRPKPKRKSKEVRSEKKAMDKKGKGRKTRKKRKRENDSDEKPRKKRKLGIPDHYKSYKPCQLSTISHTKMRYRVAFTLWPQKFSGALDRINQRLTNQNSFWKSLG